jgi:hypothetical protein
MCDLYPNESALYKADALISYKEQVFIHELDSMTCLVEEVDGHLEVYFHNGGWEIFLKSENMSCHNEPCPTLLEAVEEIISYCVEA